MRVLLTTAGSHLTVSAPLGLLSIAACLRRSGVDVEIHDLRVLPQTRKEFLARCCDPDVLWVGFSAMTSNLSEVTTLARDVESRRPDLPLLLGGVHATALPHVTLREGPWDGVCCGEGERVSVEVTRRLIEGLELTGIYGLLTRARPDGPVRPDLIEDLAELPLPAWDLIDLDAYQARRWQLIRRGRRVAPLSTSRGCPLECTFCAANIVSGRTMRYRPIEQIVDEALLLVREYGVDEFHINDDAFNVNLSRAKRVLDALLRAGVRLPWKTPNGLRVALWDDDFIALCRRSGCYQVGFGLESGDPEVLRANKKKQDLAAARHAIEAWEDAGISTFGFFILGLPGETRASLAATRRYAAASALTHVHASFAVPYPGTELFALMHTADRPLDKPWRLYHHARPFATCALTESELRSAMLSFYVRFYSSPRRAAGLIAEAARAGPLAFARSGRAYLLGGASRL